ncbi:MAG TPA: molybdenum cofactor guanylyltransferase [Acidobacteriota bacterium]|nr:molybdenum cofactor guanylyltransferase [Acidobacteriota bacterium]
MVEEAFLLCGGRGKRFGRDKRFITIAGKPLYLHQVDKLRPLFPRVVILCKKGEEGLFTEAGVSVLGEEEQESSLLCGIISGLSSTLNEEPLFLSVDMPLVPGEGVRFLRDYPSAGRPVIPFAGGKANPGFSRFPRASLEELVSCRKDGVFRFTEILPRVGAILLREKDLPFLHGNPDAMFNINRPEDYEGMRDKYPDLFRV